MTDKKIKLLIVDDEVKFLESIAKRLELRGFEVLTAHDGVRALELAHEERFDLALLDLKMPGLNGKQVLEHLKQEHRFLEVIILTGHGSLESAVDCTKLGAFCYLPKPYEMDKLIEVLGKAYQVRLERKFKEDQARLDELGRIALSSSPLGILRRMRELDDEQR
ncbi:MAG: histidine kinase [Deltaproteobacteria bacterium RIFOXYA12_FULL_61_11]|nr:MAG: histidine kinase [Deltaproteobacteria bacterium RIFOXYA12_FULL_61_11]